MCYELCGPRDFSPEGLKDYDEWLSSLDEGIEETEEVEEVQVEEEDSSPEVLSDYEAHERFDNFLNEVYETINIMGMPYDPHRVLKDVDPIRYNCEYNDWLDNELKEGSFVIED